MKLIVGLGNPGEKYEKTRHNLGFMALDKFIKEFSPVKRNDWSENTKFKSEVAEIEWQRRHSIKVGKDLVSLEKVVLIKPLTYMNLSGGAVKAVADYYKINTDDIWIIHDDIDINFGGFKIRFGGSSAGHKGVESVIKTLGTDKFWRFRLGIGHPIGKSKVKNRAAVKAFGDARQKSKKLPVDEFVLKGFGRGEAGKLKDLIKRTVNAIETGLEKGLEVSMNRFNSK